jgi:hypothetical protein
MEQEMSMRAFFEAMDILSWLQDAVLDSAKGQFCNGNPDFAEVDALAEEMYEDPSILSGLIAIRIPPPAPWSDKDADQRRQEILGHLFDKGHHAIAEACLDLISD